MELNTKSATQKPRILVIDDDPVFRAMLAQIGRKLGFEITVCSQLREVQAMAVPRLFDAVLVDYYLDDLHSHLVGSEVAAALESTPVILMSSAPEVADIAEAWPDNVRQFVSKRIGCESILETVRRWAGR